jgi:hypothetical protein
MMQLVIFKDGNSPFLFDKMRENVTELKTKAGTMQSNGDELPGHMKLPALQEILKMRPPPDDDSDDITTFMFDAEHLVGAVLGKKCGTSTSVVTRFPQDLHRPTKPTSIDRKYRGIPDSGFSFSYSALLLRRASAQY